MRRLFTLAVALMAALATCAVPIRSNKGGFLGRHVPQSTNIPTARDYVQDGLIAMWDGIENVGYEVHDFNTMIWKDLVGTNDMVILSGAPWYWTKKSFASDSSTRYLQSAETALNTVSDVVFAEICYNEFRRTTRYSFVFRAFGDRVFSVGGATTIQNKKTKFLAIDIGRHSVSIDWEGYRLWDNGYEVGLASGTDSWFSVQKTQIGYQITNSWPWWGEIYNLRFYSRTLTEEEMAMNREIDNARFF